MRFVDTNIFIYAITAHPRFGEVSREILKRIERQEKAATSTLVLCEVAWVLEAMGREGEIRNVLEKILSYRNLDILGFGDRELIMGASNMASKGMDFNDGVNMAIMMREGISEVYSNDSKHFDDVDSIKMLFE